MSESKAANKFRKAMKQILSVPKEELERREKDYRRQRKTAKTRGVARKITDVDA